MKLPVASYSFLNDYDNCPRKAHHKYVLRDLPYEKATVKMTWGTTVHKAFEDRIRHGTPLPPEVQPYERFAVQIEAQRERGRIVHAERSLGVRADMSPCDFHADDVFLRGKIDITIERDARAAHIVDWKTGKRREDPGELAINAVLLKALKPTLVSITGLYMWIADDRVGDSHDLSDTDRTWALAASTMNTIALRMPAGDRGWPPRPNPLCAWCPVVKCEHWKERK